LVGIAGIGGGLLLTLFGGVDRAVPRADVGTGGGMLPRATAATGMLCALGRFGGSEFRCGAGPEGATDRTLVLPPRWGGGTG
jgi:hypothetical protein